MMWLPQMSNVKCVWLTIMRVWKQEHVNSVYFTCKGVCVWLLMFTLSTVLQQAAITPYSAPLLILGVKNTRHLHFIYTSKGLQARRGLPTSIKYFSLSLFCLLENSSRFNQTPALLSTVHQIHCQHLKPTLFCTAHTGWIQHISVAAAPITRDLLSRYFHNPHGSTLQPPEGTASCEEHLFNLSSSWNRVFCDIVTLCLSEGNI